jgi:OOP family OmpA-OmpF porin
MKRTLIALVAASSMALAAGCATKNYVRNQTAPVAQKVNELDDMTAKNTRDIRDTDARAQAGIQQVNQAADAADQKALAAGQQAQQAQQLASTTSGRVDTLANQVVNLDNYRPVTETAVLFGFDKADLTSKAKEGLDQLAGEIPSTKGYIVALEGGTDSTGPADYNYQLSERRAAAVIQYLASKYDVPAYKIYVVGLGKDKPAASNRTAAGRAENRRVDVRLMTNIIADNSTAAQAAPARGQQPQPQQ